MKRSLYLAFCGLLVFGVAAADEDCVIQPGDGHEPGACMMYTQSLPGADAVMPAPDAGCEEGELQTSATASRSSGGAGTNYGPQLANNGIYGPGNTPVCTPCVSGGCWHWVSASSTPAAAWFELTWSTEVEICQIWVDTKAPPAECGCGLGRLVGGYDVQTYDGSNYVTHTQIRNQLDDSGYTFANCVNTTRLRLYAIHASNASGGQQSNPCIYEVKVYPCGATGPVTLEQLEAKLDALEGAVDAIESKADAIEGKADALESKADNIETNVDVAVSSRASQASVDAIEAKLDDGGGTCDILNALLPFLPGSPELPSTHPCYVPDSAGVGRLR